MKKLLLSLALISLISFANAQWTPTNGPFGDSIKCLVTNGANIYAGTYNGLFLSTNNGANWLHLGMNGLIESLAVNDSNIFVGTPSSGVYLSTDYGVHFNKLNLSCAEAQSIYINGTNIYVGSKFYGVYLSTDNGTTWNLYKTGLSGININSLVVSDTNIFAATDNGLYVTTPNNSNWKLADTVFKGIPQKSIVKNNSNLYVLSYGIYLSTNNGASWNCIDTNFQSLGNFEYSLAINGTNIYAGTYQGIYLSTNNGVTWQPVNNGIYSTIAYSMAAIGSDIFAGTGKGVYISTNNGVNWTPVNFGLTSTNVISMTTLGSSIFAGTDNSVYVTTNGGNDWLKTGLQKQSIYCMCTDGTNIYAGTSSNCLYFSTNNGKDWNYIGSDGYPMLGTFYLLASNGANIVANTDDGLLLSTNNGVNWNTTQKLPNSNVYSLAINGANIYM